MPEHPVYYSSSFLAKAYGIAPATIANWIDRDVLPESLQPVTLYRTAKDAYPLWSLNQLKPFERFVEDRKLSVTFGAAKNRRGGINE